MKRSKHLEAHGIIALKPSHPRIKQLSQHRQKTRIHGHKIWDSSYVLMDFLLDEPIRKRARMMELGCGWGLLSVFLAHYFEGQVTSVDADANVFPFADLHAEINDVDIQTLQARFERLTIKRLSQESLIVGSDICFWSDLTPVLFNCIRRALKGGVGRILIADPGRAPFFELHERCAESLHQCDVTLYEHSTEVPHSAEAHVLDIQLPLVEPMAINPHHLMHVDTHISQPLELC